MWSTNEEEQRLLSIFNTNYTFKILRALMIQPLTQRDMTKILNTSNYDKISHSIDILKKAKLIRIKEYRLKYHGSNKTAVYEPIIKLLTITISKETTIDSE